MAKSKSASRTAAAKKKASMTRKPPAVAKKASTTGKQRTAARKAAATRKRRVPVKKPVATRNSKAAAAAGAKTTASTNMRVSQMSPALVEIDNRIAIVRNNLRELVEQAASYSGASNEELISQRISDQEAKLEALMKQREEFAQRGV